MMDFKKKVRYRLIDLGESQIWLVDRVREKTGLFIDSSYLAKILNGDRSAPKVRAAICEILDINE